MVFSFYWLPIYLAYFVVIFRHLYHWKKIGFESGISLFPIYFSLIFFFVLFVKPNASELKNHVLITVVLTLLTEFLFYSIYRWLVATMQMGEAWRASSDKTGEKLITTGEFSKRRNPVYWWHQWVLMASVWYIMYALDSSLRLSEFLFLCFLSNSLAIFDAFRAKKEAERLREKFGEEYEKYRQKTPKF